MLVAYRLAGLSALGAPYAGRQMARKFKADTTLLKALVGNGGYSVRLHRRLARRGGMGRAAWFPTGWRTRPIRGLLALGTPPTQNR
jgi:hypothetical protein